MTYDVFISYRRIGGAEIARLLLAELEKRGYRVFLDVEGLQEGHFDESLLKQIEESPNFILILSAGSLDRCPNEGDWLRKEIAHALETGRRIIPVMVPEFKFPPASELPVELRDLPRHSGVSYSHELFAATLVKICDFLGAPKSRQSTGEMVLRFRKAMVGLFVGILSIMTVFAVWLGGCMKGERLSASDETLLRGLATDMGGQLGRVNVELTSIEETVREAKKFFANPQVAAEAGKTNNLSAWVKHRLTELDRLKLVPFWTSEHARRLQALGIPAEDAHALYENAFPMFWSEVRSFYLNTLQYAEMPPVGWLNEQARVTEISAECLSLNAHTFYFGVLGFLTHFPSKTLDDFEKLRPQLTRFPDSPGVLTEKEAELRAEKVLNNYQEKTMQLASLVGRENGDLELLTKSAAMLEKKAEGLGKMETTLREYDAHLSSSRAAIREKCQLNTNDSAGFMWGKILRLHTAGMSNDVQTALNLYVTYNKDRDANAEATAASARAYFKNPSLCTNGTGVLLALTENNQPHSVLKPGDVLLEWNGTRLRISDDLVKAPKPPEGQGSVFKLLRLTGAGNFQEMDGRTKPGDPRVAVADLRELDL